MSSERRKLWRGAWAAAACATVLGAGVVARAAKADKPEKPDKPERVDKVPRAERIERASTSERSDRSSGERSSRSGESRSTAGSSAPAAAPATSAGAPFEPFRIVVERNIFNPNRTGRTRATEEAAPKVEQIALVGTMESEQGRVAFFDGSDPAFQKVLRVGESVGGFAVKEITPTGVELSGGEKAVALKVNQQLRRVEGGEWRVSGRDLTRTEVAQTGGASSGPVAPAVPANASDVLRRLMEQRQKQLKQ